MPKVERSTKEEIVRTAEALFAQHGIDGVSLRQIGATAGKANNSAVHYHFGSKEQLVQAIFEYRLPKLHERRAMIIAERRPSDLRGWVACQARAVLEQSELDGSHFMAFVAMLHQHRRLDVYIRLPEEVLEPSSAIQRRLAEFLTHVPEPLLGARLSKAMVLIVHTAADRELARDADLPVLPFALELSDLVDGVVGFLKAPVSREALAAIGAEELMPPTGPMFP